MEQIFLLLMTSTYVNFLIYNKTKNITYFNKKLSTDNEKMIETASLINLNTWPSKMHEIDFSRGQLREVWVLALSIMLKIFKFEKSERTNIGLSLISHWFNVLIVYQIAINFISLNEAVVFSLIYLSSAWTYQVALYLGHVIFSQTWALISILLLIYHFKFTEIFYLFFSAICIALSFFSSSASRKYPYFWVSLLVLFDQFFDTYKYFGVTQNLEILYLVVVIVLVFIVKWVMRILNSRKKFLSIYQILFRNIIGLNVKSRPDIVKFVSNAFLFGFFLLIIFLDAMFNNDLQKITSILTALLGITAVIIYVMGPNFLRGLNRYIVYLNIGSWANHFKTYVENSEKILGIPIKDDFRGGGLKWFVRFQNQVSPVIFYFYLTSVFVLLSLCTIDYSFERLSLLFLMVLVSAIPAIVHNLTRGIQVGKAYYSQILGYFIFILFTIYNLSKFEILQNFISSTLVFVCILNFIHLFIYALPDLINSRSSCGVLKNFLIFHNVRKYSTYDSIYNDTLVEVLVSDEQLANIQINRHKSIIESDDDYFVIPNRSSKSVAMESTRVASQGLDFAGDDFLNFLEQNNLLDQVTVLRFPTIGTSKNYISESEVTGFRYFQMRDYSDSDFELTNARIIDVNRSKMLKDKDFIK